MVSVPGSLSSHFHSDQNAKQARHRRVPQHVRVRRAVQGLGKGCRRPLRGLFRDQLSPGSVPAEAAAAKDLEAATLERVLLG